MHVRRGFARARSVDTWLLVTELHRDGVLAAEAAFGDPASVVGKGRLTNVSRDGSKTEIAAGQLTFGGSAVALDGHIYVADSYLFGTKVLRLF